MQQTVQTSVQLNVQARRSKPAFILAGLIAVTSLLSGCATTSSDAQSYTSFAKSPQFLGIEISSLLDQATLGQQLSFDRSPWGSDISAQVKNSYFSAAGRQCIELLLITTGSSAVVCRYNQQQWAVNRDLTVASLLQE